jgi:N-methylhydantoinase B
VITFGDGCANPPHGVLGGTAGIGGGQYVEHRHSGARRFTGASGHLLISLEERWVGVSTGGGGYGDPAERDVAHVCRDVSDGVVSELAARSVFGVALRKRDGLYSADPEQTSALRAALRARPRRLVEPVAPASSTWLRETMREGDVYILNPTI